MVLKNNSFVRTSFLTLILACSLCSISQTTELEHCIVSKTYFGFDDLVASGMSDDKQLIWKISYEVVGMSFKHKKRTYWLDVFDLSLNRIEHRRLNSEKNLYVSDIVRLNGKLVVAVTKSDGKNKTIYLTTLNLTSFELSTDRNKIWSYNSGSKQFHYHLKFFNSSNNSYTGLKLCTYDVLHPDYYKAYNHNQKYIGYVIKFWAIDSDMNVLFEKVPEEIQSSSKTVIQDLSISNKGEILFLSTNNYIELTLGRVSDEGEVYKRIKLEAGVLDFRIVSRDSQVHIIMLNMESSKLFRSSINYWVLDSEKLESIYKKKITINLLNDETWDKNDIPCFNQLSQVSWTNDTNVQVLIDNHCMQVASKSYYLGNEPQTYGYNEDNFGKLLLFSSFGKNSDAQILYRKNWKSAGPVTSSCRMVDFRGSKLLTLGDDCSLYDLESEESVIHPSFIIKSSKGKKHVGNIFTEVVYSDEEKLILLECNSTLMNHRLVQVCK